MPYDPPIEPVYPIESLIGGFGIGSVMRRLLLRVWKRSIPRTPDKPENLTDHGVIRWNERGITKRETEEARRTAMEIGAVRTKIGKYGTQQIEYSGQNGITVIIETSGRNAGKIITYWRN